MTPTRLFSNWSNGQPLPLWFLVVLQKLPIPGLANRIQFECELDQLVVIGKISVQPQRKGYSDCEWMVRQMSRPGHPQLKSYLRDYCPAFVKFPSCLRAGITDTHKMHRQLPRHLLILDGQNSGDAITLSVGWWGWMSCTVRLFRKRSTSTQDHRGKFLQ